MSSTDVRYTIFLMDEVPDAMDAFSSTSSLADVYWEPMPNAVGGNSIPTSFKLVFTKLSVGDVTVLVDSDAVVLAYGWDAYLYHHFQDPSVGMIGINPRGKTHGMYHRDVVEWNWCACRTIILKDALEKNSLNEYGKLAAESLGRPQMEQGGVMTYLYCLHNMSMLLFPATSKPFQGKSPTISGNLAGTLNWAIHMFYLSRRRVELSSAPATVMQWVVDESQEKEILTWVRTRNATSYWWCFNSTNILGLQKQTVYLPKLQGFPCAQTALKKTHHSCKPQTSA